MFWDLNWVFLDMYIDWDRGVWKKSRMLRNFVLGMSKDKKGIHKWTVFLRVRVTQSALLGPMNITPK